MINNYNSDPYSTQNNVYGGAAGNGQQGSQTNGSAINAAMQNAPGNKGNDAFTAFANAAQQWANLNKNPGWTQPAGHHPLQPYSPVVSAGGMVPGGLAPIGPGGALSGYPMPAPGQKQDSPLPPGYLGSLAPLPSAPTDGALQPGAPYDPTNSGRGVLPSPATGGGVGGGATVDRNGNPIAPQNNPSGPGGGQGGDLNSLSSYLKSLMNPLWQQQQEDYLRSMATAGANSGAINSGAYPMAASQGLAGLINQQQSGLAGNIFTASESEKDRAIQEAIAKINGEYGLSAAKEHAAASQAAANASAGASKYATDIGFQQFQQELPYQDKWHGYNFQLGEDQLGSNAYQYLLGLMGGFAYPPAGILPNLNPTGYVGP